MLLKLLISMITAVTSSALLKDAPPTSHPPTRLPSIAKASAPPSKPSLPPAPKPAKTRPQVIQVFEASDHANKTAQQWRRHGRLVKKDARPSGVILKSKEFLFAKKDTIKQTPL